LVPKSTVLVSLHAFTSHKDFRQPIPSFLGGGVVQNISQFLYSHNLMNHVQGNRVELVINHLYSIQFVGVERFVPFKNDSPQIIGGTAHMRAIL
jgi:hypothetical protein